MPIDRLRMGARIIEITRAKAFCQRQRGVLGAIAEQDVSEMGLAPGQSTFVLRTIQMPGWFRYPVRIRRIRRGIVRVCIGIGRSDRPLFTPTPNPALTSGAR